MVKLLFLFVLAHAIDLLELAGAVAIVVGLGMAWGMPAALIGGGAFALLKAFEMDLSLPGDTP